MEPLGSVEVNVSAAVGDPAAAGASATPSDPPGAARVVAGAGRRKAKPGGRKRRTRSGRGAAGSALAPGTRASKPAGPGSADGGAAEDAKTGSLPVDAERGAGAARAGAALVRARRRAEVLDRQRSAVERGADFSRYHRRDAARRELMRRRIRWTLRQATKEVRERGDLGMATAEYAVALLAAVGLATVLYKVVTGGAVQSALQAAVMKALHG
ncbi:DUF4244 domain-containing protein [Streptomyces sp. NEAU-H3]|uniref:DUF4244 domain-containing protein n=1 Tax=Streptomyces sp. NEAU-H3 TaxID=2720636 RepID=UPI00280BF084|nr:DUF4244 domain-containing protein [Streptomyces sp. NEAU-H3]